MDDPPTAGEVIEQQRAEDAQRGRASTTPTEEELATEEAGGEVVGITPSGAPEIEGPNSA